MDLENISWERFSEMYFKRKRSSSSSSEASSISSDIEDLFASSDDTDDTDDILEERASKKQRVENFMENIVPNYSDEEFKSHFRLTRPAIDKVELLIKSAFEKRKGHTGGRECISAKKGVHFFVWYLANQETFRQICDRFNISEYSGFNIIIKVSSKLCEISNQFIKFPTPDLFNKIADNFEKKKGLKNIIGAIDGSHIPIRRPKECEADYVNRKQFHSILLQGVCDNNKRFIDIYCGEPGSLHDSRLLRKSPLYKFLSENRDYCGKYCLLGDSAYPSLTWLVPPYKDTGVLTPEQMQFNTAHSATRVIIENAFALLKGRFRRLRYFENLRMDIINKCVIAACVLHNLSIDLGDEEVDLDQDNSDFFPTTLPTSAIINECEDRRQELFNLYFNRSF